MLSVIPTQAGISWFDRVMDSRSRGSDGLRDFSPVIKTEESGHMLGMVDLTDLGESAVGDEVVFPGRQGTEEISADEIAKRAGTIPYEIVTRMSRRLPRIYLDS